MEYAELTDNALVFSKQTAGELKCKFRNNNDLSCCASYSLTRNTWKIGLLKKPYLPRNIRALNFYVAQVTVEDDSDIDTDSDHMETLNSTSTSQTVLSPSTRRFAVHAICRVYLGNIFRDVIKANPSLKIRHMQTTLRSYLKREPTLQFTSKVKETVLKSVFGNENENIGNLPGALQLLEGNGYKTHFEVFTAKEMISIFVKNRKSAHRIKWKNTPISQRPLFDTDALRLTIPPVEEKDTFFAGWIIAPPTSLTMASKLRREAACDGAFISRMGIFYTIVASDANWGLVPRVV